MKSFFALSLFFIFSGYSAHADGVLPNLVIQNSSQDAFSNCAAALASQIVGVQLQVGNLNFPPNTYPVPVPFAETIVDLNLFHSDSSGTTTWVLAIHSTDVSGWQQSGESFQTISTGAVATLTTHVGFQVQSFSVDVSSCH